MDEDAQRIARQIIAQAPAGWTAAALDWTISRHGVSMSGGYMTPGAAGPHSLPDGGAAYLVKLTEILAQIPGGQQASVEMRCWPSGEYSLVVAFGAVRRQRGIRGGFQVVLDPGYRLPQPGAAQEGSTAAPAGDPQLAAARFREYLERRAAILGQPERLPPPASATALGEAERRIGRPLPADLRALYLIADGEGADREHPYYLFGSCAWLDLESLVAAHARLSQAVPANWESWDWVVFDADPRETVRRCRTHPAWLPFGTGHDGNYMAVDLAPARNGRPGQVIWTGRDYARRPAYTAGSVTSMLGGYLEALERGAYEAGSDPDWPGSPVRIQIAELVPGSRPVEIVGAMPGEVPPGLQAIHINDAPSPVDLAPLTASTSLQLLHLNRCATTDLTPIRTLPVQSLRVTLDGGDLTPLEGHPHLASLDLGSTAPADIAPLRTIANLRGLDLSRASVQDLAVLARLPDLRYLALTAQQWTTLMDESKVPSTLAAARLASEEATLDEALAWSARLGAEAQDSFRVAGTLPR